MFVVFESFDLSLPCS